MVVGCVVVYSGSVDVGLVIVGLGLREVVIDDVEDEEDDPLPSKLGSIHPAKDDASIHNASMRDSNFKVNLVFM